MKNNEIPNYKAIAEINLSAILLKAYIDKDFNKLEDFIKNFCYKNLLKIFNIKEYAIYKEIINVEWNKIQYVFLNSLANLSKNNLLTRAKLDAGLLINMPIQILLSLDKIYQNKNVFKDNSDEEDYLIGLMLLFPQMLLIDANKKIYTNKEAIKLQSKDINNIVVPSVDAKKKFKQYAKKINDNKNSLKELKKINASYDDEVLALNKLSIIGKKILFKDTWQCSFLAKSRATHKYAHGQKRNEQGYFVVGGENFRYCGDWSNASIGNVVNCRCYIVNNY